MRNTTAAAAITAAIFQTARSICDILIVQNHCKMSQSPSIVSAANPLLKEIRKAIARGALTSDGCWVAEGFHLLEEALRSECEVQVVLASDSARQAVETFVQRLPATRVVTLSDKLFESVSATETTQGVIALVKAPVWSLEQLFGGRSLVVVLDALQDPGNAGAIARTAEAFGATGVLFLKGAVSPFNPKTIRASAGSLFRLPFLAGLDPQQARAAFAQHGIDLYAAVPARPGAAVESLSGANLAGPCGLIIGSEGHGISEELRSASRAISVPTVAVESLNAAVAAGILLYEARRQRSPEP
jgi:TrmH family RNA methyltransferase